MFNSQTIPGYIRTYVPLLVAWLVGLLAERGVIVPEDISTTLATLLGLIAAALYYALVRLLEKHKGKFGWLLLAPKQPVYVDPAKTSGVQVGQIADQVKDIAKPPVSGNPSNDPTFDPDAIPPKREWLG